MTALLRANPAFRLLWTARTASYIGDSLGLVALLIYLEVTTGQALAVATLLIVVDFVPGLLGPFTGAVGDRFDLRRVLVACDVAQGLLTLAVAVLLPPLPVLLLLVGLRGVAAQVFQPASRSAVPALVPDKDLETANSALGAGTFGLEALGPLLAAALLPVLDTRGLLFLDAATFGLSAVLLALLPPLPREPTEKTFGAGTREGVAYIWRTPVVRAIGLGFVAVVAFSGVDDVALVFLGRDALGAGDAGTALLYAGIGIGLAVGYVLLARYGAKVGSLTLIVAGFAISSAGNLLTGLAWAVGAALALQTVRGLGVAALDVGVNTHVQRVVPPDLLGRVFGNLYGAVGVAAGVSYVLGGVLLELTGARTTFVVAGAGGLIATAATAFALGARTKPSRTRP
ncbi:MFS transporter [Virgisporangium ochraceum]|uniref:MFS transporter n=1 Tax=Virgisporangium ochraceum TaxID=65505 RepID=A0A8J4EAZ6_9ACTN|nr:MFS transporter [Virgisporangium ochraceum]GIJ68845.1 MFS transporter [Virgisporangium ochraceum]